MKLKDIYIRNKNTVFSILIVIFSFSTFYFLSGIGMKEADNLLNEYLIADSRIEKIINAPSYSQGIEKGRLNLLQNQYEIIKYKKAHHLKITKLMNSFYFGATVLLLLLSVVLGILFIQVANTGIKEKKSLFKTVFFTILSLVTFFGLLIQVLNHKENINVNKKAFLNYSSVQLRIYNYIITEGGELSTKRKKTLNFNQFMTSINREINKINTLSFEITHENIKSPNDIIDYGK
jgi:hypothetical protein